jgi:hypothetical protein
MPASILQNGQHSILSREKMRTLLYAALLFLSLTSRLNIQGEKSFCPQITQIFAD